jgi:hypothetical protein
MNISLGKLEHLDPRVIWKNEAADFTPWLANHIELLGAALDLDLQVVKVEQAVGDFSCDIMAHEIGTDRQVIIENQLETTDHRHLGQLLTYAGGLDAAFIVWISPDIREEHRQALDWLNRHTDEQVDFFGIQLEAIRIDGANPAVQFRLMAFPNKWGKAQATGGTIAALRAHRTLLLKKLETAPESEKPQIREKIAEYDRRIANLLAQSPASALPASRAAMPLLQPAVMAPVAGPPEELETP